MEWVGAIRASLRLWLRAFALFTCGLALMSVIDGPRWLASDQIQLAAVLALALWGAHVLAVLWGGFGEFPWGERLQVNHHGIVATDRDPESVRNYLLADLRAKSGVKRVETEGERIRIRLAGGMKSFGTDVTVDVLPGPDGSSYIAYEVAPRVRSTIVDYGAGLRIVQRLRNYAATIGA